MSKIEVAGLNRIKFICSKCRKKLQIDPNIFSRIYQGNDQCLSCRSKIDRVGINQATLDKVTKGDGG